MKIQGYITGKSIIINSTQPLIRCIMAEVILKNVCKIYEGGVKAVNSVSIDIHDKEFMVLVGP